MPHKWFKPQQATYLRREVFIIALFSGGAKIVHSTSNCESELSSGWFWGRLWRRVNLKQDKGWVPVQREFYGKDMGALATKGGKQSEWNTNYVSVIFNWKWKQRKIGRGNEREGKMKLFLFFSDETVQMKSWPNRSCLMRQSYTLITFNPKSQ